MARLQRWATRHARLAISPAQARLLAEIEELSPSRIGDLARADHCSQPTMSTQVQRLEELGLASRESDPADARAVLITITMAGQGVLSEMREARAAAVAPLLADLSLEDRERLSDAVEILVRLIDAQAPSPGWAARRQSNRQT
jgi:DNA-binding MarR family transcriptional regulator